MKCEKCGNSFSKNYGKYVTGRFCSRACANSQSWSEEHKKKLSEKMKGYRFGNVHTPNPELKEQRVCKCGNVFECWKSRNRQFCSFVCSQRGKDKTNSGGARLGSGRSKSGYYNGV